jgi:signal transduction histidine kinase
MQRQVLDVNTVVRELVSRVPTFSEKSIDIQLAVTEFPLFAEVDRQKLQSVLYNILCNAIDAIPVSGHIRFSTSRRIHETPAIVGSSEVIAIQCSDSGAGIPDEQLTRIFDPFFTTKDPGKGMGLGLSLCHRIIESFNGDITVQSAVGQGTTVTVYLPPASKSAVKAHASSIQSHTENAANNDAAQKVDVADGDKRNNA